MEGRTVWKDTGTTVWKEGQFGKTLCNDSVEGQCVMMDCERTMCNDSV